tara:strand:+ start:1824 stop:3941 length:2118 start_codon:yes stop_codon:yes gene_type:complete
MNISILLPYKENFSESYAGAVALYVNDTARISKHRKRIKIYGNTDFKKTFNLNYKNIPLKRNFLKSQSKLYVSEFIKTQRKNKKNLIEVHNRPAYIKLIREKLNQNLVLYFHNDPLSMAGSKTVQERLDLITICSKIIFNSQWTKTRFLNGLNRFIHSSEKLEVIQQSATKTNIEISKKKKIITFTGKLNTAKGYDLFGKAIIKILDKYKDWKANVIGDELREKISFKHKNLKILGFLKHKEVLKIFNKTSIAVACSRWEEPFGRTSLEASSRGCSVIISNRGGLPETITNGVILKKLSHLELYKAIEQLIKDKKKRQELQKLSLNNFYLTHKFVSNKIDKYRDIIAGNKISIFNLKKNKTLKILHVTNFNERHNGRLFYNTGRRLNNGFLRLNHSVLEFSDRDIVSYYRSLKDLKGSKKLNKKLIEVISNYLPDLVVLGHADLIGNETLDYIKKIYPNTKIAQWFLDRMDSDWKINRKRFEGKFQFTDANFCTTSPEVLNFDKTKKIFYIPNPVDKSFETLNVFENKTFSRDLFFAMSHGVHRGILKKGKFDVRENFINELINLLPSVKFDIYGMADKQPIWADQYLKSIANSKMALNLSQGKPVKYYSSDRISQMVGNGLLTFVDKKTELNDFFTKDEIIFYNSTSDLADKINKYNKDDKLRISVAKAGRDKYFKYFNSTLVAEYIINKTFDLHNKKFFWENK